MQTAFHLINGIAVLRMIRCRLNVKNAWVPRMPLIHYKTFMAAPWLYTDVIESARCSIPRVLLERIPRMASASISALLSRPERVHLDGLSPSSNIWPQLVFGLFINLIQFEINFIFWFPGILIAFRLDQGSRDPRLLELAATCWLWLTTTHFYHLKRCSLLLFS